MSSHVKKTQHNLQSRASDNGCPWNIHVNQYGHLTSRSDLLPGIKAAPHSPSKHPLAQLLSPAQLHTPVLPGVEGLRQALVLDPVGNGPAGLLAAVELLPRLPGGGHSLVLQPG